MWPFFNPKIKVVTFRLRGWCVLGVFFLPEFTRLGHERQDLLSPCDEMHVCTDWTSVHTLIRKSFGGIGVWTHVNSKGKIPSPEKCPQRRIEPATLWTVSPNTTNELFRPPLITYEESRRRAGRALVLFSGIKKCWPITGKSFQTSWRISSFISTCLQGRQPFTPSEESASRGSQCVRVQSVYTGYKDPDFHVLSRWMLATGTHPACIIAEDGGGWGWKEEDRKKLWTKRQEGRLEMTEEEPLN